MERQKSQYVREDSTWKTQTKTRKDKKMKANKQTEKNLEEWTTDGRE